MEIKDGFKVEIECGYGQLWRYNMAVTCGCFDAGGNRVDFFGAEDVAAEVGANLTAPPEGVKPVRRIGFATIPCDHLLMYVYVIPHSLPEEREISALKPFDLNVRVSRGSETILDKAFPVNCWSGLSLELRLPKEKSE